MFRKILERSTNAIATPAILIGVVILVAAASLICFTFGYWLITLILATFFNFILPFSYWYAFGAWLICVVIGMFIAPGIFTIKSNSN